MANEVAKPKSITQDRLPEALAKGEITQTEVDRIWEQTSFVSAQTPIEFRRALIAIGANKLDPLNTLVLSTLMDMRAVMTRDESKFAHLVAGTEVIVKTLQNVNPLVERLRHQENMIDSLSEALDRAEAKLDVVMEALSESGALTIKHEVVTGGYDEAEYLEQLAAEEIVTREAEETEEEYDGNVGSAWDKTNPAKGPVKLPTAKQEYEEAKAKYEGLIEKHRTEREQSSEFRRRVLKHS